MPGHTLPVLACYPELSCKNAVGYQGALWKTDVYCAGKEASFEFIQNVLDEVAYHEYGMPASKEECDSLGVSCRKGTCVILLNHGLLTHAPTIHGALQRLYMLERACELELISRTLGEAPMPIAGDVIAGVAAYMKTARAKPEYGLYEWNALLRVVEAKGTDYRR